MKLVMKRSLRGGAAAVAAIAVGGALSGCVGRPRSAHVAPAGNCAVTAPDGSAPVKGNGLNYGNDRLSVVLWPKGVLLVGPLPGGGANAVVRADGSIYAKQGWWRQVAGRLRVEGRRLDRSARPLDAEVPEGYDLTGFQPVGITFPTTGCWRIVGHLGSAKLEYVVRVKIAYPAAWLQ